MPFLVLPHQSPNRTDDLRSRTKSLTTPHTFTGNVSIFFSVSFLLFAFDVNKMGGKRKEKSENSEPNKSEVKLKSSKLDCISCLDFRLYSTTRHTLTHTTHSPEICSRHTRVHAKRNRIHRETM